MKGNAAELLKAIANQNIPGKDRGAAAIALRKLEAEGVFKPSKAQKTEILWDFVVFGPAKEVVVEVHAAQDAREKFCATCFLKHEGETFAANACTRCGDQKWVKPSEIGSATGNQGYLLRSFALIGQMSEQELRNRLYISGPDLAENRAIAKGIITIMQICGYEVPAQPYGNHNAPSRQFYLSDQDELLPTPKIKAVPSVAGYMSASYSPSVEEIPCDNYPSVHTEYNPGFCKGHPADDQVW